MNLVAPNFRAFEVTLREGEGPFLYRKEDLDRGIERWTNILLGSTTVSNPKIGISVELNFEYFCILYACINIGANFVILDGSVGPASKHNPFLPLDIIVMDYIIADQKDYWLLNARVVIDKTNPPAYTQHTVLEVDQTAIFLSATTSGTTSAPTPVTHTYDYMLDLTKRNSQQLGFNGRVAHVKILHHGSSLPSYFLPSVSSDLANFHYCAPYPGGIMGGAGVQSSAQVVETLNRSWTPWLENLDINHMLLPYTDMVEDVLKSINSTNAYFSDLTLYTLSYIRPNWANLIKGRNIKIISIFGCTETSGHILLNCLSNTNLDVFDSTIYQKTDDFFKLTPLENGTRVQDYKGRIDFTMKDQFEQIDETYYRHLGRTDICRINDIDLDVDDILKMVEGMDINGQLVVDIVNQKIYLALWEDLNTSQVQYIVNKKLVSKYSNLVQVSKTLVLDKEKYMSGIKLSPELLRYDFRS